MPAGAFDVENSGGPLDNLPDRLGSQGISCDGPAPTHATEQESGVDRCGLHPAFDPHHGGGSEVKHGPFCLLIGLAASYGDESRSVVPGLDVIDGECRDLRDPQQRVAHDRDQGRVPKVLDGTGTLDGETQGIRPFPGDSGDLTATPLGSRPGESPHGLVAEGPEGIVESPVPDRPPHRGDRETSHGRGSSRGVEVTEVAREGRVDDGPAGAPGLEPLQRRAVVPEGVLGHRVPDQLEQVLAGVGGQRREGADQFGGHLGMFIR